MDLIFLGKETAGGQSPTLYATDRSSYVVQGWIVTDPRILAPLDLGEGETVVEVYARLLTHLAKDGLSGEVAAPGPPIVVVKDNGNYIIKGAVVTDPAALAQMDLPPHETCVEVPRLALARLC